jgi:hypothetical protein
MIKTYKRQDGEGLGANKVGEGSGENIPEPPKAHHKNDFPPKHNHLRNRLDNGRGRVLSEGEIKVSDKISLRRVALVQSLGYNLLSLSQLLDEGFEVLFQPGDSRILDSRGDLVCMVVPEGQVFHADFCQSFGVERCFLAGSSSELWK